MDSVEQMISSVGFPIFCCIVLGFFIYQAFQKITTQNAQREERLYAMISECQATNEKLTQTNAEFVGVLNIYQSDINEIKEDIGEIKERLN